MFTIKCKNITNITMTNTIRVLNDKTIMLTQNGKTKILTKIKNFRDVNVWYTINGEKYA